LSRASERHTLRRSECARSNEAVIPRQLDHNGAARAYASPLAVRQSPRGETELPLLFALAFKSVGSHTIQKDEETARAAAARSCSSPPLRRATPPR
jgi:hypothetical protein